MKIPPIVPQHMVAITGFIKNEAGLVLLKRSPRRGWELPGGKLEVGEDLHSALEREVREETGIEISVELLAGIYSNLSQQSWVILTFTGKAVGGSLSTSDESIEVGWFPEEDIVAKASHPAIKDCLKDMLAFRGRVLYRVYTLDNNDPHGSYKVVKELYV